MLRDNLVELIEPMLNSAGADPLALYIHTRTPASDDRLPCLKNPRPEGAESSLTESASSPFQAEPAHTTNPAERFGYSAHGGRIAKGMDGDLVVLRADPAQDVTAFSKVRYTIRGGKVIFSDR